MLGGAGFLPSTVSWEQKTGEGGEEVGEKTLI